MLETSPFRVGEKISALLAGKAASFIKSSSWFASAMKWTQIVVFIGIAVFIFVA